MSPLFTFSTFKTQLLERKTVQMGTHAGPAQHPASTKAADTDENHLITNCSRAANPGHLDICASEGFLVLSATSVLP